MTVLRFDLFLDDLDQIVFVIGLVERIRRTFRPGVPLRSFFNAAEFLQHSRIRIEQPRTVRESLRGVQLRNLQLSKSGIRVSQVKPRAGDGLMKTREENRRRLADTEKRDANE